MVEATGDAAWGAEGIVFVDGADTSGLAALTAEADRLNVTISESRAAADALADSITKAFGAARASCRLAAPPADIATVTDADTGRLILRCHHTEGQRGPHEWEMDGSPRP